MVSKVLPFSPQGDDATSLGVLSLKNMDPDFDGDGTVRGAPQATGHILTPLILWMSMPMLSRG